MQYSSIIFHRVIDDSQKVSVNEDYQYAVYVSYVKIFNNYTYDLLDAPKMDIVSGKMKLTSKMLREDSYRNMYVHGAVEVESPEEALETFYRGQKQRKTAETQLNIESSRSHSIITLRVVAVPMDALGEDILPAPPDRLPAGLGRLGRQREDGEDRQHRGEAAGGE